MKTIEERAKEYASKKADISLSPVYNDALANLYEEGYIAGATEQKAIDEEVRLKKCDDMTEAEYNRETAFVDWYLKNGKGTPTYSDAIEWARRDLLDKAFEACENELRRLKTLLNESVGVQANLISVGKSLSNIRKKMEEQICQR